MRGSLILFLASGCHVGLCSDIAELRPANVLAVGDSLLAFGSPQCMSAIDFTSVAVGRRIDNAAVGGAMVLGGDRKKPIPSQFVPGDWSTVIVGGGGNDLSQADVCDGADPTPILDQLATKDGLDGAIPQLVDGLIEGAASVVLVGYHRIPDNAWHGMGACDDELGQLRDRYQAVADARPDDVTFVDLRQAIGAGDEELLAEDHVHPNPDGAAAIADLLASALAHTE